MTEQQKALLSWLSMAIQCKDLNVQDLKNANILHKLVMKLPNFPTTEMMQENQKLLPWQTNYVNFKSVHTTLEQYFKTELKSSLPIGLPSINLMQISKGQDKQGLISLLIECFAAAIKSKDKQNFISHIMKLNTSQQEQIMLLIQEKGLFNNDVLVQSAQQNRVEMQQIQKSKIDQLYYKLQSLAAENQSLTASLMAQAEQKHKLKQQITKQQQQLKKLKRQIDEKSLYIQQKQVQEEEQQSTLKVITDSNQQVIQMLKRQLVEQEQQHLEQKKQLKDKIEIITQQLSVAQDKIVELQSEDLIGITTSRKILHQNCVSINQHKNITQKLQMRLTQLTQKQTKLQRELITSKHLYQQLAKKCKKQQKQKENLKMQYEKVSNNRSQLITIKDAEKMKLSILQAIKQKLKSKLVEQEKKNAIKI